MSYERDEALRQQDATEAMIRMREPTRRTSGSCSAASIAATWEENDRLRSALRAFLDWGERQCPCRNEEPNPCPLCGASVENLEACKAIEEKFPRSILAEARAALSKGPTP